MQLYMRRAASRGPPSAQSKVDVAASQCAILRVQDKRASHSRQTQQQCLLVLGHQAIHAAGSRIAPLTSAD